MKLTEIVGMKTLRNSDLLSRLTKNYNNFENTVSVRKSRERVDRNQEPWLPLIPESLRGAGERESFFNLSPDFHGATVLFLRGSRHRGYISCLAAATGGRQLNFRTLSAPWPSKVLVKTNEQRTLEHAHGGPVCS